MCSIFLDTNILIDYIVAEREEHEASQEFVLKALGKGWTCSILLSSLKDVYYIIQRSYDTEERARRSVKRLRGMCSLVDLDTGIVDDALASDEPDFEDGLIRAAAERVRADMLVTRDKAAFQSSALKVCTAAEALELLGER